MNSQTLAAEPPEPVEIRIPKDHPRAEQLVALFYTLTTGAKTPSGIFVSGGGVSDEAVRIFLNALRKVLAEDGLDLDVVMAPLLEKPDLSPSDLMAVATSALSAPLAQGLGGDRVKHQGPDARVLRAIRTLRDRS
jgi:hypothetical protein